MALVVDTGPLYAWFDGDDPHHDRAAALLETTAEALVVPAPVLVEVDWLSESRGGHEAVFMLIDNIERSALRVLDLDADDYRRIRVLMRRYADFPLGLVDAAVVAICERLGETKVATLDHRHFGTIRPRHCPSLQLLPHGA